VQLVLELGVNIKKIPFISIIPVAIMSVPLLFGQSPSHLDALMLFSEHNSTRSLSGGELLRDSV
jgi:hypothetical protein